MEIKKNFVINAAFYGIVAVLVLAFWKYLLPSLIPFAVGFIIASIVQFPLKQLRIKNPKLQKGAAILCCIAFYALLGWVIFLFSSKIISEVASFAVTIPDLFYDHIYPVIWIVGDQIQLLLEPIDMSLAQLVNEVGKTVASALAKYATEFSGWLVKAAASGVVSIPGALIQIIVTIVASFYIAADYKTVTDFLKKLIPARHREYVVQAVGYAETAVVVYIKSYSIMFILTFLELWAGLSLLKIPYTLGLSFAIAVFDLMPILGVGGVLLPWSAAALVMGNMRIALGTLLLYLVICAVRNAVEPRLVGHQIGLHPLATLVAMMVGLELAGIVGMMLLPISLVAFTRIREGAAPAKND